MNEPTTQYTAALIEKWKPVLLKARHIFTWSGDGELAWLAEQASLAANIIEVGVYMGASSFVMVNANPAAHLWAVDPFMVAGTQKVTEYMLRDEITQGRCEVLPKSSPDAAAQIAHMSGKIDLCFVDDGHAHEDVVRDIKSFLPLMRPGGMLCGHDYEVPFNDVARAVNAMLPGFYQPVSNMWAYPVPPNK